jgi:hypothetical protein
VLGSFVAEGSGNADLAASVALSNSVVDDSGRVGSVEVELSIREVGLLHFPISDSPSFGVSTGTGTLTLRATLAAVFCPTMPGRALGVGMPAGEGCASPSSVVETVTER